jgi:putative ABC transport system ATP-binding protein
MVAPYPLEVASNTLDGGSEGNGESMSQETGAVAIEARGASRHYTMGEATVRAVEDVSFVIERGEFAALLGPSGSGKSTLLNLIAGLDRLSAGRVVVAGQDLSKMDSEALACHRRLTVGMIFQSFNLVPTMTLADNIELPLRFAETPRSERRGRVLELLTSVGLAHRAHHKPTELSGGEQQRAAIARALANRPGVLLADEPTGNLDSHNGQEVMALLSELNTNMGVTVLLVTHDPALASRYARKSLHMADGRLVPAPEALQ